MIKSWFALGLCILLTGYTALTNAESVRRCNMCGMDASVSQTEFTMHLNDGSTEYTCCFHCVYLLQNLLRDRKIVRIETRDFTTGTFIDAEKAFYLAGSSLIPKGSMAPFLLAFADKASADRYMRKYGGRIVNLTEAMDIVRQFDNQMNEK